MLEENKLNEMLESFLKKVINKDLRFYSPKNYLEDTKFQLISSDSDEEYRKLGDPAGYCLAWSFWYLEMRLKNPDIEPKDLVESALTKILDGKQIKNHNIVLDYIRDYSNNLDNIKNDFLKEIGVKKDDYYNITYNHKTLSKINNKLIELLKN